MITPPPLLLSLRLLFLFLFLSFASPKLSSS